MATTGPALSPREQRVTIYVDANGDYVRVDPDPFVITKSAHQEVLWQTSPPGAAFRVDFGDTPFNYPNFNDNDPYSGEVRRDVNIPQGQQKYYKYTVTAGSKGEDPGGVVNG